MSLTVVFRQTALRNLARIRSEDKDLFGQTRHAIALLADQPYPKNAVAWGATGVYRLHSGGIRVLYEVDDEAATVYIINIGVIPESADGPVGRREPMLRRVAGLPVLPRIDLAAWRRRMMSRCQSREQGPVRPVHAPGGAAAAVAGRLQHRIVSGLTSSRSPWRRAFGITPSSVIRGRRTAGT